jgi:hypothetical protein
MPVTGIGMLLNSKIFCILQVNLGIPILFLFICSFLVFLPFYADPVVIGMALLITSVGIPVYFVGVEWKNKPNLLRKIDGNAD